MDLHLTGKVALVTGSGRGIGADTVLALAEEGCRIVVSDIDPATAAASAAALKDAGHDAVAIPCDVTDEAQVATLVEHAEAAFGRVDILVNNAGYLKDGYLAKMSLGAWESGRRHHPQGQLPVLARGAAGHDGAPGPAGSSTSRRARSSAIPARPTTPRPRPG